jgi:hypothetical protein
LLTKLESPPRSTLSGGMIKTLHQAIRQPHDRTERMQRWMAVLVTALLHLLLLIALLMPTPPTTMTPPQGRAGGGAMEVSLLDEARPTPPEPIPPVRKPVLPKRPKPPRAIKRPVPTPVVQATVPMPPEAPDTSTGPPAPASAPSDASSDSAEVEFTVHARRDDENARASAALAAKLRGNSGRSNTPEPVGPAMGVDGFHVYYELANETRLRAWRDQGMTELFLPLPGTRRLMVCPLEVALHRGSSACRMVEMDSPELKTIGDAREVIDIDRVYQLGDVVWSGPGPYR